MPHILIISANFYEHIANMLLEGAVSELEKNDVTFEIVSVPGCLEIPVALAMARTINKYDGFITLGCVIRGETTHYDLVCGETMRGINNIMIEEAMPLGNGVLTVENEAQAIERASVTKKNKGGVAARAALDMIEIQDYFIDIEVEEISLEMDEDEEDYEFTEQ